MRRHIRVARPERNVSTVARATDLTVVYRPIKRNHNATQKRRNSVELPTAPPAQFQIDPYLDYGRFLTAEGGILIIYKDIDLRWRHIVWRIIAWAGFTGLEADYLFNLAPEHSLWIAIAVFLVAAIANWFIVARPVELYRRIEIRPDYMIIDDGEIFWARFMEGGLPNCRPRPDGTRVFCGVYGTRFVEFLTIRRFDDMDRMPEVMSAHLQDAMRQLWMVPH